MAEVKNSYTTGELTKGFGTNKVTLLRRAARENWKSVPRPGRGGGEMWLVSSMPEKTRRELASALAAREARLPSPELEKSLALLAELPDARRARAEGRAKLARAARLYIAQDADPRLLQPLVQEAVRQQVPVEQVPTMKQLGTACGIAVGSAVAVLLR